MLDLIVTDLVLALELASEHGVTAPMADAALAAYLGAEEAELGRLDYSAVHLAKRL